MNTTQQAIKNVVAEFELILDDIETDNDNCEHNVGDYRASYVDKIRKTITDTVKMVEEAERDRIKREVVSELTWYRIDEGVDEIERGVNYIKLGHLYEALTPTKTDKQTEV